MQILMTGITKQGCNDTKRKRIERLEPSTEIAGLLRRNGWVVDQRPVIAGEELSDVDMVWANVGSQPSAVGAKHAPGALWAMHQAIHRGIPLVVWIDDWDLRRIKSGFRYVDTTGVQQLMKTMGDQSFYANAEAAVEHADAVLDIARQFESPDSAMWRHATLAVNRFRGWGSPALLNRGFIDVPISEVDLTPLILPSTWGIVPNGARERRWTLASLTKQSNEWTDEQGLRWPVERYGWFSRRQPVLRTERHVVETYAENWGVLCPSYYHAGSGWFRTRIVFAAAVGAVLLCGREDAKALGPAYQVNVADIERLSDGGLRDLAAAQRDTLWPLLPLDEGETLEQIETIIQLATERAG